MGTQISEKEYENVSSKNDIKKNKKVNLQF